MKAEDLTIIQYIEIKKIIIKCIVKSFPEMILDEISNLLGAIKFDLSTMHFRHLQRIRKIENENISKELDRLKGGIILHFLDQADRPEKDRQEILFKKFN